MRTREEQEEFYGQEQERLRSLGYTCIYDGGDSILAPRNLDEYFERLKGKEKSYITHNLRVLTSDMSLDEMFQTYFGCSREEKLTRDAQNDASRIVDEEKKKQERVAKIPRWIADGKALIYPELYSEWETRVRKAENSNMEAMLVEDTLGIMHSIDSNDDFTEAKEKLQEIGDDSVNAMAYIRITTLLFSKQGPDFYEATADSGLSDEEKEKVARVREENAKYELAEQKRKSEEQR